MRLRVIALAAPLLLSACASIAPSTSPTVAVPAAAYHERITLDGRLSVRYLNNGQEQAVHGNFSWRQTPEHTVITLRSPLGQTLAVIDITPHSATLTQNGQPARRAADPDTLASEALGWPLPIAGMRSWLQGRARDAQGQPFTAPPGSDAALTTADGWRLRYSAWEQSAAAARPKRIDLSRHTAQAGNVELRIVLDTWQPG